MTSEAKHLLIGASGQVGAAMLRQIGRERCVLTSRSGDDPGLLRMDLPELTRESAERMLDGVPLQSILCIAGMTDVEGCEGMPDLAYRTNARGPAVLADYAHKRGCSFVFFSTEYVFDGTDERPGPYAEDGPVNPLSVYGKSKLEGERGVLDANPDALIVRTTVVFGPDPRGKNYVYSLIRNLQAGRRMRVPEDQVSTPTYNRDLAAATAGLLRAGATGIFHVCGPDLLGRMEFARIVARRFGLDADLLDGVPTAELGQRAPRPLRAGLATTKLRTMFPTLAVRNTEDSLLDCAAEVRVF